jgi:murein L,D-transpeptidase YcbB/YkuD
VHIVYITVGQAEDGELRFWRDIYERHDSFTRIDLTAALGLGVPNIATAELR